MTDELVKRLKLLAVAFRNDSRLQDLNWPRWANDVEKSADTIESQAKLLDQALEALDCAAWYGESLHLEDQTAIEQALAAIKQFKEQK